MFTCHQLLGTGVFPPPGCWEQYSCKLRCASYLNNCIFMDPHLGVGLFSHLILCTKLSKAAASYLLTREFPFLHVLANVSLPVLLSSWA